MIEDIFSWYCVNNRVMPRKLYPLIEGMSDAVRYESISHSMGSFFILKTPTFREWILHYVSEMCVRKPL